MAAQHDSPPRTPDSLSKPKPWPSKSPAQTEHIRIQNRRREYLERNPEYFKSDEHELAAPLAYDTFIRRFQSAAEREAEGRAKGYGRVMEGSLLRGEAQRTRVAAAYVGEAALRSNRAHLDEAKEAITLSYEADAPADQVDGRRRWEDFLRERFVRGGDEDFVYGAVDGDEGYDVLERKDEEERWFDEEDPEWVSEGDGGGGGGSKPLVEKKGETGILDY